MLFNVSIPSLSEISDRQIAERIQGYLATLNDQLRYMMMNIDEDNLSDSLADTINTTAKNTVEFKESIVKLGKKVSAFSQTADKINWFISDGNSSSDFSLTSNAVSLISDSINIQGFAKFSDLENSGYSIINGSNIISGSITADKLSVSSLESISANIGGWEISDYSISSRAYGQGYFSINSASSADKYWIKAEDSYGNPTFYVQKNGSCFFNGSYISGGTITADKISTDSYQRLDLLNNYYGINVGKELCMSSEYKTCRFFINPAGVLTFDTGVGNTSFSFSLTRNGSTYTLSLLNGAGTVIGTIPIQ